MRNLTAVFIAVALTGCGSPTTESPVPTSTSSTTTTTSTTTTSTTTTSTSTTTTSTTTTSTTTSTTSTTTTPPGPTPAECVALLPPALRIGQVLMPVVEQAGLAEAAALAERGLVGGVVVIGTPDEGIVEAVAGLQDASTTASLVIAVDEEGGTVQRLDGLLGRLPSAHGLTELEPRQVRVVVADRAAAMADLGFTMNLAPVLDVGAGPGIGSRSFGDEPGVVTTYGRAFAEGVREGGLVPVVKHFPGHGRADADSHDDLPVTPPLEEMEAFDLLPWRGLPDGVAVMVGHLDVPGLTDGMPASLSPAAVDGLLRDELGFDGVVVTDDLAMGAVEDVIPVAWGVVTALDDGRLATARLDEAVERVFALRGVDPCTLVG